MTLAVVFRELKAGRLKLEDRVQRERACLANGRGAVGRIRHVRAAEHLSHVHDLIQGTIVQSGNDACIILAEGIGGSEEAFVKEMNEYRGRSGSPSRLS